jgi:hypothetical protein
MRRGTVTLKPNFRRSAIVASRRPIVARHSCHSVKPPVGNAVIATTSTLSQPSALSNCKFTRSMQPNRKDSPWHSGTLRDTMVAKQRQSGSLTDCQLELNSLRPFVDNPSKLSICPHYEDSVCCIIFVSRSQLSATEWSKNSSCPLAPRTSLTSSAGCHSPIPVHRGVSLQPDTPSARRMRLCVAALSCENEPFRCQARIRV